MDTNKHATVLSPWRQSGDSQCDSGMLTGGLSPNSYRPMRSTVSECAIQWGAAVTVVTLKIYTRTHAVVDDQRQARADLSPSMMHLANHRCCVIDAGMREQ